jgi:hypothetical protein
MGFSTFLRQASNKPVSFLSSRKEGRRERRNEGRN